MTETGITIAIEEKIAPEVKALLDASDAFFADLYPPESNHLVDVSALEAADVTFFVARISGRAVGCGGYLNKGQYGEIKRLFVGSEGRGRKVGRLLMQAIIDHAQQAKLPCLKLEMGPSQPEAEALYQSLGFAETGPFGDYREDPYSLFMEKTL
ncbi:GNAT family N-acetyltransferase [Aestuariispira insulae]|uniref:Putative acetyltransferase n=1 Tax=Aestuariispira insulae TaxID=1461337 RepID=A0A3D9HR96_9PROT|nr:GNAT family N-acetyltransferase [Aestuariispira insulae]RED52000.1 putative acetyltransferase [Aestuariispira insulae]